MIISAKLRQGSRTARPAGLSARPGVTWRNPLDGASESAAVVDLSRGTRFGVDDLLPLFGGHGAQMAHRSFHHGLPAGRKLLQLAMNLARLLLLFRSQMLPSFHAVQHTKLLLRGQTREVL